MMLKVSHLSKHFGGVQALQGVRIQADAGKITALIGPNGSGKTTLFNAISRIMPVDKGIILINGIDVSKAPAHKVAKETISRTFQQVRLFKNLTIREHLELARSRTDESLFKSFFVKRKKSSDKELIKLLKSVRLNKPLCTFAADLSYGQRKLLDLAVALAKPHSLLLLDEPVAGVNPGLRQEIKIIIKELVKQGETILLIEHDMNFVMDLADKIFVLESGRVIAKGTPQEIQSNKRVLKAYLGE